MIVRRIFEDKVFRWNFVNFLRRSICFQFSYLSLLHVPNQSFDPLKRVRIRRLKNSRVKLLRIKTDKFYRVYYLPDNFHKDRWRCDRFQRRAEGGPCSPGSCCSRTDSRYLRIWFCKGCPDSASNCSPPSSKTTTLNPTLCNQGTSRVKILDSCQ